MKRLLLCLLLLGLCLNPIQVGARDEAPPNWKEILEKLQRRQEELECKLEAQQKRIEELERGKPAAQPPPQAPPSPVTGQTVPVGAPHWTPAQPISLARSGSWYMNISLDAMANVGWSTAKNSEIRTGHHAPYERGFSLRSIELAFDGAVDPYFKGLATVGLAVDENGGTEIELEEAWAQTTSLPANLQFRVGQFFAEFGRQNAQHAHEWAFVDQPLVLNRFFGGDGLRNPGARLSWLAPTPFYAEVMLGVFHNRGESFAGGGHAHTHEGEAEAHAHSAIHGGEPVHRSLRGPQDLLFVPRVAMSFDLSDTQTLLLGASAAFGPNSSGDRASTQIFGVDLYWKWKSTTAEAGFPFFAFQTEALYRRYEAAAREHPEDPPVPLAAETLGDWGFYSQVLWGFRRNWVAGLRGEFVNGDNGAFRAEERRERTRVSPNLTWYLSEYSKLRLQYNYDRMPWRNTNRDEHSIWLQFEFGLGSHSAHKF